MRPCGVHGGVDLNRDANLPPGVTLARQLFRRVVIDSQDKIDRYMAVHLVAQMLGRSDLDVGLDIGISNMLNWHP